MRVSIPTSPKTRPCGAEQTWLIHHEAPKGKPANDLIDRQTLLSGKEMSVVWLHNARIIAVFAVVFLHTTASVLTKSPIGSESWWVGNLYDSLVRWCVPVFVMISGALLLDPNKNEDLKAFYTKRLSRILLPILFWSAFYSLGPLLKNAFNVEHLRVDDLARAIVSLRPHFHLWFLYMIIFLYLFTPFFRKIISSSSRFEIAFLITLSFAFSALNAVAATLRTTDSTLFSNQFLSYIPYFFLGYFVRTSAMNCGIFILCSAFSATVFLTAVGCYVVSNNHGLDSGLYFYSYLSITVIPMSVCAIYLLKNLSKPMFNGPLMEKISFLTLGVYLLHPFFLEIIQGAGYGPRVFNPLISIPLISIGVFSISLVVAWGISIIPYIRRVI